MTRPIQKLFDPKSAEELKVWADKIYARFPCLPVWSVGAFFSGAITVGQKVPHFLLPDGADGFVLTHLKATFQAGTLTTTTKIEVSRIVRAAATLIGIINLLSTDVADTVYEVELSKPLALSGNDIIKWNCTQAGGHEEVTAVVMGRQAS